MVQEQGITLVLMQHVDLLAYLFLISLYVSYCNLKLYVTCYVYDCTVQVAR